MNTRIEVISLPDATDRREGFTERAKQTSLAWRFFDAQRGLCNGLRYDEDAAIVAKGRPIYTGELGCYASHFAVWNDFLGSADQQLMVLEDDTIVDWGMLEKLAAADLEAAGISYLRLYAKRPCAFRLLLRDAIEQQRSLIEYLDRPLGTQGYVMTRKGAERFVRHCQGIVRRPLDDELDRSWDHGVACLCLFPFPVIEQVTASGIGPARFEQFNVPRRLLLKRQRMKMVDRLLRLRQRLGRLRKPSQALRMLAVSR